MSFAAILMAIAAPVVLGDPAQEARAHSLEMEIRCVQCQNEPIAQSTSEIAADMRTLVRARVAAGDSDGEIRDFFRERYGDFVLFRPPVDPRTWALWGAPVLLLLLGLWAIWSVRRSGRPTGETLAPEEGER
ncbi:MAG: cytochrome c-type biogenesis protein CcmH [Hyphomonadaceae bacterium JAD_PAG50586_4]|nr:MAG: cytochrome c-type biogenesis protein CcmH [Hyphomonadaceae bacterium JAD_PAG50586_4]